MNSKYKSIKLGIHKNSKEEFVVSKFLESSKFTEYIKEISKDLNVSFYLLSEIKGSLDIEGDGSSRKIINDLILGKRKPTNQNEFKAINLHSVLNWINQVKPQINKENIMVVYNMLKQNIDMGSNNLEDNFKFRQSNEDGYIIHGTKEFKTPSVTVMNAGMDGLINFINSDKLQDYPLEKALLIQIIFIYFHPFYDFNGRTGRLLTYWYLTLVGENHIKNLIYLSLPENKDKYLKIWNNFRKVGFTDLTSFMNWLGSLVIYSTKKLVTINDWSKKHGVKLNETEQIILFYLIEYKQYVSVIDLMKKVDLGLSKQAVLNAVNNLIKCGLIKDKFSKNTLFIIPKININDSELIFKKLFDLIINNPTKQDFTMDDITE